MKNSFFIALLIGLMSAFAFTSCDMSDDIVLDNTPDEIQAYVNQHFPGNSVRKVVKDIDHDTDTVTFEVSLTEDNTELEFNAAKEIIEIESDVQLPDSVIPDGIRTYVQAEYPANFITDWELENGEQHVGLDNDTDLVFNANGDFLRLEN